jgi:glucose/arabinose dehydrogenase
VQFVVELGGTIRIVQGGTLLSTPFLDLTGAVGGGGERGLLSLAFPPGASETRRFFVTFVNTDGHTVVSRFSRSAVDPLRADPSTRFDLQWSTGERFISHPETLHYGGNLVFGADGYLYVGTGDGGEENDASHQAQNLSKLHGKLLRINVSVADTDPEGLDIPPDNPFAGGPTPEIWAIGLRNPWRFTLDDPVRGGTGALIIADVGESAAEEVNYEPAGRGGRNYGWRNLEGTALHDSSLPPAFGPLTDPIYEYDHGTGRSITGGFVYRGSAIPSMYGRYVFGDFVRGRVWSMSLAHNPSTGEATAGDIRDHTAGINASAAVRLISSFGTDAFGELYVVNYGDGTIVALVGEVGPKPLLQIDAPVAGGRLRQPFTLSGWALDATAPTPGIDTLHVWAYPASGASPQFVGVAGYGGSRPDVAAAYGPQFQNTGFGLTVTGLAPGEWWIVVYGLVTATQTFSAVSARPVTIEPSGLMWIDVPGHGAILDSPFFLGGWAIDLGSTTDAGVQTIHVWAYPADGGPPTFVGVPHFGPRPDVAAYFGPQFVNSGFGISVLLPAGNWSVVVYAMSSSTGQFDNVGWVGVTVR